MLRLALLAFLAIMVAAVGGLTGNRANAQNPVQTQPIDPFGQEVALPAKTIVYVTGMSNWDSAFDTLVDSFKTLHAYLDMAGLKSAGPPMTIYTAIDDTGFEFQAAIPVDQEPKTPPEGDITIGKSPDGKALKFVHRGPFELTVTTYDAISHYLEEKMIDAKELLIEEYVTDLELTPDDKVVINIFIPLM